MSKGTSSDPKKGKFISSAVGYDNRIFERYLGAEFFDLKVDSMFEVGDGWMIRNKRKQMKFQFHRKISKLPISKTQYLSLFICASFTINVKKDLITTFSMVTRSSILLFSITPACVWAIDREGGAVCDRVESSYRISDFALLRINGVALLHYF